MEGFITWDALMNYTSFITIVYMVVEFTKELKFIKKIPTMYWSFFVSVGLLVITNVAVNTFELKSLPLYILSSIGISLGSNGLSNFNKKGSVTNE